MISVDYSVTPWLITIPKSDLTLDTGTKYNLTVDTFWELLRNYADSAESMPFPIIYSRIPATASTPSITEIDGTYYELQFEDGLYSVDIINGNTNIRNVEKKNQVSVSVNNTTGFIDPKFLESGLFHDEVSIDVINGVALTATGYTAAGGIIGTPQTPVDNVVDAKTIAANRGLGKLHIVGNITIGATDILSGYIIHGEGPGLTTITFIAGCSTSNTSFTDCELLGTLSGAIFCVNCHIGNLSGVGCTSADTTFYKCLFKFGTITLRADNTKQIRFNHCSNGAVFPAISEMDINGTVGNITNHHYSGGWKVSGMTNSVKMSFDTPGGELTVDSTCTAGTIIVRGDTKIIDNSGDGCNVMDETSSSAVWNKQTNKYIIDGTFGKKLGELTIADSMPVIGFD